MGKRRKITGLLWLWNFISLRQDKPPNSENTSITIWHSSSCRNPRGKTINDLVKCPARKGSGKTCNTKICAAPSLCQRSNVVFIATCSLCGKDYLGTTAWKLHDRVRLHAFCMKKRWQQLWVSTTEIVTLKWKVHYHQSLFKLSNTNRIYFDCTLRKH